MTTCVSVTRGAEGQAPISSLVTVTEPKGMAWKMHHGRVRLGQGKVLHQGGGWAYWNRIPGAVVTVLSLPELKKRVENVLRNTV